MDKKVESDKMQNEMVLTDEMISYVLERLNSLYDLYGKDCVVASNIDMFKLKYIDWKHGKMCTNEEFNNILWNCAHQQDSSNTGKMDVEYAASIEEWILCCLSWLRSNGYGVVREYWEGKMKEIIGGEEKEKEKESK